jgi:peptidoglycan/xylan/chitin deacetylase (PgdA/CDA1 family)
MRFAAAVVCVMGIAPLARADPARRIAITLDDLPGRAGKPTLSSLIDMNNRVLAALQAAHAPAIGFVNEARIQVDGERDARVALLRRWLDAGMTLGNHTFRHRDLSTTPLAEYEDDVIRGEVVTRALLESRSARLVYFRHPFTHTGPTAEIRQAFERFLADRGYRIAPFTIEDADFAFSGVYDDALARGEKALAHQTREQYLAYFDRMCAWFETLSRDTFGREIPQILLIHVNTLNAETMPELLARLGRRGYRFITLDEALSDEAYRTPDLYVGKVGPSWLHRWSIARKLPFRLREDPDPPKDFAQRYSALRRPPDPAPAGRP